MQVEARRILGRFPTPEGVARGLARRLLRDLPARPRVLDPASGEGALLLAVAAEARTMKLSALLTGYEKDAESLARARVALRSSGARLARRDFLHDAVDATFDVVIANPPWVSFSGREAVALPEAEKRFLRARFESFEGWPQLQGPFLERALDVTVGGGRLGFVLPRQVLDLESYGPLRRAVTKRARVVEVALLGEGVFEGVCEPAATVVLERLEGSGPGSDAPWLAPALELPRWAARVLERLARFPRLPRTLVSDPGVHTGNAAARVLSTTPRPGFAPCREGRDVKRYALEAARRFVASAPALAKPLYATVHAAERFARASILVRQTADRPIAARHQPIAYFRNSVLAVAAPPFPVEVLLALLNSRAFALVHRAGTADARQRSFPQVKVAALAALPFPVAIPAGESDAIRALVRRRERGAPVEAELERRVARLFRMDDEDAVASLLAWLP